jgi:hypothetical protein
MGYRHAKDCANWDSLLSNGLRLRKKAKPIYTSTRTSAEAIDTCVIEADKASGSRLIAEREHDGEVSGITIPLTTGKTGKR